MKRDSIKKIPKKVFIFNLSTFLVLLVMCFFISYKQFFLTSKETKNSRKNSSNTTTDITNVKNTITVDKNNFKKNIKKIDENSYDKLVEQLLPKVVHIKGIYLVDTDSQQKWSIVNSFGGDIVPARKTKVTGNGSGFFISSNGYILTNYHVIEDVQEIDIETHDGHKYKGKIIGYDEGADLALLKINNRKDEKFSYVKFGKSDDTSIGDHVIVIGGPYGYKSSVSSGIVSGKSREDYRVDNIGEFIQIDAPSTHGNSGGPLFNTKGEVIGMITWGYEHESVLNFALAEKTMRDVLPELKKGKNIARGYFGISVKELEPWDVKAFGLKQNEGMLIQNVTKGSPADKSGIKRGDLITEINGQKITDKASMVKINRTIMTDTLSKIVVNRYGTSITFDNVGAINNRENEKLQRGENGLLEFDDKMIYLRLITKEMHDRYRLPKEVFGAVITSVKENDEPLFMLSVGDIIMQINDKEVNTLEEYGKIVHDIRKNKKDMAIFHIYRPTTGEISVFGSKF